MPIYDERLDYVLDAIRIPPNRKMLVNLDAGGYKCHIIRGTGDEILEKIELTKLEWHDIQECEDKGNYLQALKGFNIWGTYKTGTYGGFLPPEQTPKFDGVELYAETKPREEMKHGLFEQK